jgi:hypothetical protein
MAILDEGEAPKPKNTGGSVLSVLVSIYFIVRGGMYLSNGNSFGWIMVILGLAGGCFKIYEMVNANNE